MKETKKLYRFPCNAKIAGVCEGFSRYFAVDVVLVRLLFLIFLFIAGGGGLAYLICWLVVPSNESVLK